MKIPYAKIDEFISAPTPQIKGALVYGPDSGLVTIRAKALMKSIVSDLKDPFNVADINYSAVKDNISVLYDEANSMSLLGGRKVIKLRDAPTTLLKDISEFLKQYDGDNFIVFTSDDLKPTSVLRKLFEKEKHLASLPCYKDDINSIKSVIRRNLTDSGYQFDNNIVEYLSGNFLGDRMVILSELEKLITYVGKSSNKITIDDAVNCIGNTSEVSLENLYNAVANQNSKKIEENLQIALKESIAPIVIIRTCLNYFLKLQAIKSESIATNIAVDKVVSAIRPPIFFKQVPVLKSHLSRWKIESLNKAISSLVELERDCKSSSYPDELVLKRFFTIFPLAVKN